jgi:Na+-transporting methylmalonyl-CoA/oxaloacetate decarboxylase gamma subunit
LEQNLLDGLSIAFAGLAITFLSLGLFGVIIYVLGIVFKEKQPNEESAAETPAAATESAPTEIAADGDDLPIVIATAISYFRSQAQNSLGSSLEEGKSGWWAANRMSASQGLGIRLKRSGR